jgi:hypothetical protein
MSSATAYPSRVYDVFASACRSSQPDFNALVKKVAGPSQPLASEQAKRDAIDVLLALPQRYREKDWNGEGSDPIPEAAFQEAGVFLEKLPPGTPLPEVNPEPDGYLGLEWYANKRLLYVVSFNGKGALSCSGLIGFERISGTRYMDESIPAEILRNIAEVIR